MTRTLVLLLLALSALAAVFLSVSQRDGVGGGAAEAEWDIVAGARLYADYCASCHGADLEGQGDWRSPGPDGRLPAPPHDETGHTWHHGDALLFDYTKLGGTAVMAARGVEFDSGMPGFADSLTDDEIHDILAYIKSTWPERIRKIQAERSGSEN